MKTLWEEETGVAIFIWKDDQRGKLGKTSKD